jgi:hypothetical protein
MTRALLPYRPKPQLDELLSSWLIRLANAYRMEFSEFLDLLGLQLFIQTSNLDRVAPQALITSVAELTGTEHASIDAMLLHRRLKVLNSANVDINSRAWPWSIPIGVSRLFGRINGFQICPLCLLEASAPHFTWQSCVSLYCSCTKHGVMLIDRCPNCGSSIHASAQGLLGIRRASAGNLLIQLEICSTCCNDLRFARVIPAPANLIVVQSQVDNLIRSSLTEEAASAERFVTLRHLVSLLYGENLGLESFRSVVAQHCGIDRVDIRIPYESDQHILPYEESDVATRANVLSAAIWLTEDWPNRFVSCSREAEVRYPALQRRGATAGRSFGEIAMSAYGEEQRSTRKPPRSVRIGDSLTLLRKNVVATSEEGRHKDKHG